ncbi:leucine-rich repeat-containing protein 49 [Anabrus simplex]|uniref:leucine-rich repeat-containing protein 49 n=1 Tax=Anabrus simplex TaxID=316456 RepID=UPI0035A2F23D
MRTLLRTAMDELSSNGPSFMISDDSDTLLYATVVLLTTPDGQIQACRSQQEKEKNPDRISLDRRGLTRLPILMGESRLRLLSLQHNLVTRLDGLAMQGLTRLVFLDIYDNQLDRVSGLDSLINLRVLLMGKNRIRRIEGLNGLNKLEVLDLHGNQIYQVGGLSALGELKLLNLAGNQIRVVGASDLQGLQSLQELNLRRNRIKHIMGFDDTPQLQKLFLSNNELHVVDNMSSIMKASQLREITIDGNPVSLGGDCVSFLVSYLPNLKMLSHMEVTDSVRKAAMTWRNSREASFSQKSGDVLKDVRREEVISNARTNWELLRSQTRCLRSDHNLSGSLKDLRSNSDYEVGSERNAQSDSGISIVSSFSANAIKPVARGESSNTSSASMSDTEKRRLKFSKRTCSQDSDISQMTTLTCNSASLEYFRLPPILVPLLNNPDDKPESSPTGSNSQVNNESSVTKNEPLKRCDSLSSVEPNVDSSLSSLPSDSSSSDEIESSEELASPQEVVVHCEEAPRNVKSATHYRRHPPRKMQSRATTARPKQKPPAPQGKVREQGGDFLVEICGRCLNIYGQGALRFIDRPWNSGKAADVTTVRFNYINFDSIIPIFGRLKIRFPNVEHFIFRETNIHCMAQLNALADVQGLTSLLIESEGNSITQKEWKRYAIYRLSHWGLKVINGNEVTEEEVAEASEEFEGLSDIVLWSLPESLLQPLLSRLRLEGTRSGSQLSAKQWLWNADPALRSVVAKEALQWRRGSLNQEDLMWRHKGRIHLAYLLEVACAAVEKLHLLDTEWPSILSELVTEVLVDYSHLDSYMKKCMQSLKL